MGGANSKVESTGDEIPVDAVQVARDKENPERSSIVSVEALLEHPAEYEGKVVILNKIRLSGMMKKNGALALLSVRSPSGKVVPARLAAEQVEGVYSGPRKLDHPLSY